MTLAEAVAVLNEHWHRGRNNGRSHWYVDGEFARGEDQYDVLEEFEAIAIAEKYARESDAAWERAEARGMSDHIVEIRDKAIDDYRAGRTEPMEDEIP